jgi:hypothetical protein
LPLPTKYDNVEPTFGMPQTSNLRTGLCSQYDSVNGLDYGMVDLDIGDAVCRKFLPWALAAGKFQAKPDPWVLEGGLEKVQDGINIL